MYDVREKCQVPPLCYDFSKVDAFLAQPEVAAALGVTGLTWQSCNRIVSLELVFAGDWMRNLALQVPAILASGVRIVVYSGEYDFVSVCRATHPPAIAHAHTRVRTCSRLLQSRACARCGLPTSQSSQFRFLSLFLYLRARVCVLRFATGTAVLRGPTLWCGLVSSSS